MDIADHKALLRGITIPPCPAILGQLMAELKNSLVNTKKVARLISQDVGIAAIVIRSANSPLIGGGHRIASIADAI
ncbi:MAG: HDOD domain-containing protein, partial [Azoarcus sp.]|nr:HDOD domain-containing protein [Azoarcus sp.]